MATQKPTFSLKDKLFNRSRVQYLAGLFTAANDSFDAASFVKRVMASLKPLELKERIVLIATTLQEHLAADFPAAASQIVAALPAPLDPSRTDDDFGDFIFAPLGEFVVRNGLSRRHCKRSLKTLKEITQRFSMEDAIRAFINEFPDETLAELQKWSTDRNYHVRRLVTEGTRPILPWSKRISLDVSTALPLLDTLHADNTRYVTRSVANHLNDITKSQPDLVLRTLKRWGKLREQSDSELQWMTRHALRTMVKQGDARALRLLGYRPEPRVEVHDFSVNPQQIRPGDAFEFSFTVSATRDEPLVVDYVIDFVKANGQLAPKVFKLKQVTIHKGDRLSFNKRHVLRANATTYTLYPGWHGVTVQINGKASVRGSFELL